MLVLQILGWVALALLCLVAFLLVVPIHLAFAVETEPEARVRFELRLLSARAPRVFRIRAPLGAAHPSEAGTSDRQDPPETSDPRRPEGPRKTRRGRSGAWTRRMLRAAPDALRDTFGAFHIDRLRADGWFGFRDPADTGQAWGWIAPLRYGLGVGEALDIRPDFTTIGIGGRAELALHFVLWRVIAPGLRLIWVAAPWRG